MSYANDIIKLLKPTPNGKPLVLDLFAGCGGLALGFEAQGFETLGFEMDKDCCNTYRRNLYGHCEQVNLTPSYKFPKASVVIGGPPCQPFSVGGEQKGIKDSRDGFPIFISAVEQSKPDIWMFENVRGLMYRNKWYLDKIIQALEELGYIVEWRHILNAVDYLVPQNRERLIVVGHKGQFRYPKKQLNRVTAGDALDELAFQVQPDSKFLTSSMDTYVAKYELASKCINPRDLQLNKPARTLTCRNLAGATGDM
ncbi:MAG: DNA cytosine methyltransferase, partial [Candidatus Methylumidiphilus sp.]